MSKRKIVMLAKKLTPAYLARMPQTVIYQPKINGQRCRASTFCGRVWLFSSQGNVINSVPHINDELQAFPPPEGVQYDGELYCHGMPFQDISSIVRKTTRIDPHSTMICFHIYDIIVDDVKQEDRHKWIDNSLFYKEKHIMSVMTFTGEHKELDHYFDMFVSLGFEGIIIRDPSAYYHDGKTNILLKKKRLLKGEFKIVGAFKADAVKGVQVEMLGGFMLLNDNGNQFNCGAGNHTHAERREMWLQVLDDERYKALLKCVAVIEYPEFTKRGIPHQPILKEIK